MQKQAGKKPRLLLILLSLIVAGFLLSAGSCTISPAALDSFIKQGLAQGLMTSEQARLIREAVSSFQSESQPFTAEEERAIGRVVAAAVLAKYPVYEQPDLAIYLNKLGQGLAFYSDRPHMLGGYHVIVLDSKEAHAIAAPGGYVLITRGLLKLIESEDMLAALLAHEISHVALGHGLASLTSRRMGELAAYYATLSAMLAQKGDREALALMQAAVRDFVDLVSVQGYSQAMEFEADGAAVKMLASAGYRPMAMGMLVKALEGSESEEVRQYSMLHPLPQDRLRRIEALVQDVMENERARLRRMGVTKLAGYLRRTPAQGLMLGWPAAGMGVTDSDFELVSGLASGFDAGPIDLRVPPAMIHEERFARMRELF